MPMRFLATILLCLLVAPAGGAPVATASAEPLIFLYNDHLKEPYIFVEQGQVVSGIHWDLAQYLGQKLGRPVIMREAPRKRVEQYLLEGKAHVLLLTNPAWLPRSDLLHWTIRVYTEHDQIIQRQGRTFNVESLEDLSGKRLGTIQGYIYEGISDAPYRDSIIRDDAVSFRSNFLRLKRGRLDAIIVPQAQSDHLFRTEFHRAMFHVVTTWSIPHELFSAVSPHSPVSAEQLSAAYRDMHRDQYFERILARYR
ncbi:substrate-binding periplasmic protein [Simiduia aestuariiviva]|uniref:ABC-type amino acid transport substrate-binding protein n=1 Tax=Simiduia aestuariiviva TaxID=1510459 RepID=A0A839UK94_9GAMM|nr:ABC transporter substrate-binding protein [Simiduia aestuariiviva]MBB3167030.1 ABC-type amino acid transport substrate-binding protein [Simiduia aestuariiviva]